MPKINSNGLYNNIDVIHVSMAHGYDGMPYIIWPRDEDKEKKKIMDKPKIESSNEKGNEKQVRLAAKRTDTTHQNSSTIQMESTSEQKDTHSHRLKRHILALLNVIK